MHENVLAAGLHFSKHAKFAQLLQVDRGGLAFCNAVINQVADTAIGLFEQQFDELPRIGVSRKRAATLVVR